MNELRFGWNETTWMYLLYAFPLTIVAAHIIGWYRGWKGKIAYPDSFWTAILLFTLSWKICFGWAKPLTVLLWTASVIAYFWLISMTIIHRKTWRRWRKRKQGKRIK